MEGVDVKKVEKECEEFRKQFKLRNFDWYLHNYWLLQ
jgi:hypothetical protein